MLYPRENLPLKEVTPMETQAVSAPKTSRISDRTRQENEILGWNSRINLEMARCEAAGRAGDFHKAYQHRELAEGIAKFKATSIAKDAEFAEKAKKVRLKPIPANYVPKGVPVSELTDHQRLVLKMDQNIENYRQRADRFGVEGEYSEDVATMHALSDLRESSIRSELGLRPKSASVSSGGGGGMSWAWALMAFAVFFAFFIAVIPG